jgi:glycerophosphoryl diester phosphodiesterase
MRPVYPRVVAHRGGGSLAPENTLGAIRYGASLGLKGVEFDVRLAGDGTPVVIHDPTLERTTDGRGEVALLSYAEIARFDAGARSGEAWRGERVPRFEDVARLCCELGLWANVEIKAPTGSERAAGEAVARAARELWRGAEPDPVLSSFSAEALEGARDAAPEVARALLVSRRALPGWAEPLAALECVALHVDFALATEALVREQHASGRTVLAWTVNDPDDARRLLAWGVDSLVTDALERIGPDFG